MTTYDNPSISRNQFFMFFQPRSHGRFGRGYQYRGQFGQCVAPPPFARFWSCWTIVPDTSNLLWNWQRSHGKYKPCQGCCKIPIDLILGPSPNISDVFDVLPTDLLSWAIPDCHSTQRQLVERLRDATSRCLQCQIDTFHVVDVPCSAKTTQVQHDWNLKPKIRGITTLSNSNSRCRVEGMVVIKKRETPALVKAGLKSHWKWNVIHDALRAVPSSP